MPIPAEQFGTAYCYLGTTGRVSGLPREIEIWFGTVSGSTLYLLAGSGEKAQWVRNLRKQPKVTVRVNAITYTATARVVEPATDEDALARKLLVEKYQPTYSNNLTNWGQTALPVALEVTGNR